MSDAPLPVIGDLLKINQHLEIQCCWAACRRKLRLSAADAVRLLGPHRTMAEAERVLRCQACGARGRRREITARPCSIDGAAWFARETHRQAAERGQPLSWDLASSLDTLARLAGGPLGGDGPVHWSVEGPSSGG